MSRVAIYARYSDDKQNPSSIDDQLTICREEAHRNGWRIIGTYKDAAISGASMVLRPGIKALINDARRGFFDVILAEALDRLSRDQADIATLFKELQFLDIPLYTLAEGKISELHVGLKGTMNVLFLKDLANTPLGRLLSAVTTGFLPLRYRRGTHANILTLIETAKLNGL